MYLFVEVFDSRAISYVINTKMTIVVLINRNVKKLNFYDLYALVLQNFEFILHIVWIFF